MVAVFKYLISGCALLLFAGSVLIDAAPPGCVEGHLKIISPKEVELADRTPPVITAENHALIVLSEDWKKEIPV